MNFSTPRAYAPSSVFFFNGDIPEGTASQDDTIETFGANAGYAFQKDLVSIDAGLT